MTPEEKKLNSYYLRTFGWTLEEVNALFEKQGGVCAICKRPPGKYRLSLDHDHAADRQKLIVERMPDWNYAAFLDKTFPSAIAIGSVRSEAKKNGRRELRRRSVRGLLCIRCNKGLQMFEDSKAPLPPEERFDAAAEYIRRFKTHSLSEQK